MLMLKNIFGIVLLLFLTSCGLYTTSIKMYTGDQRPPSEVAIIESWKESRWSPIGALIVHPMTIDGHDNKPQRGNGEMVSYSMLPGKHKVKIMLFWNVGTRMVKVIDQEEMVFHAKAGHLYLTKAYAPKEMSKKALVSFWIEDANTATVVAGTKKTNMNAFGESYKPSLPRVVPGTATDSELQSDITQQLFVEASKYYHDCKHNVLKAEVYRSSQRSVIASEMGGKVPELEQRLRDKSQMLVEKWFVKSCDTVSKYEVLLLRAETGTDIMVKKLEPLQ